MESTDHVPAWDWTCTVATADPTKRSTLTRAPVTGPSGPFTTPTMRAVPGPISVASLVTVRGLPRGTVVSGTASVVGGPVGTSMTAVVDAVVGAGPLSLPPPPPPHGATKAPTSPGRRR